MLPEPTKELINEGLLGERPLGKDHAKDLVEKLILVHLAAQPVWYLLILH